ncbi:MAG: MCE family protein [Actinobacteria bacterium]|nr:MCE family protein [Actinomycetota bacterium]
MITRKTILNLAVFVGLAALLTVHVVNTLVIQQAPGRTVELAFADASGLAPRNDVTMRGVPVGSVATVELDRRGVAIVTIVLDPGITVPGGTRAGINRRSPIGDMVIELSPGRGEAIPDGARIGLADTTAAPDAEKTIEVLARVLHAVPSEDLSTLVHELAVALEGRGEDLASLSESTALLPERLLEVRERLEALIETGPEVTGVLADNADALADDITQTAALADILRDNRFDLVELMGSSARFAEQYGSFLGRHKANLACVIRDFGHINEVLARPDNLDSLAATLDLNHFFFVAVDKLVQTGKDDFDWFRVQLLPHQEPPAQAYPGQRPPPDVLAGKGCRSIYGPGVGPGTQPGGVVLVEGSELDDGS